MRIFISYRREEQPVAIAAWGLAQICKQAGCDVFMDVEIPPLADWKQVLRDAVAQSTVMLVAVGPQWSDLLTRREKDGTPDWVRFEVTAALDHGIPVGPVLFGDVDFDDTDTTGYWDLQGDHLQFDCNRFTMFELTWDSGNEMSGHWYRLNDPADRSTSSLRLVGPA